jgi:outer membrane protein assembly factor BamB
VGFLIAILRMNNRYKKYIVSVLMTAVLLTGGCSKSVIKIPVGKSEVKYSMFGRVPSRDFYFAGAISDSIILKWQFEANGSFPASTVTIHDNYVFINDLSGRIFCYDLNTGKTAGQLKNKGSIFTTPVIEGLHVIYVLSESNSKNSEYAVYDFSTGKFIAEKDDIAGKVITEMIKLDKEVLFITETGRIYCYNFYGYKNFEYNLKMYTHSSPAYKSDIMVFGNDDGELTGFNIKQQKVAYRNKISGSRLSGVSVSGNTVLAGDYEGNVYAADLLTGKKLWAFNTGKRIEMIPASDDETVFAGNLGGELYALDLSSGEMKWKASTGGLLNAAPLVTDNLLVVPDYNKKIHFINKQDRKSVV